MIKKPLRQATELGDPTKAVVKTQFFSEWKITVIVELISRATNTHLDYSDRHLH